MDPNFDDILSSPPPLITFKYPSKIHRQLDLTGLRLFILKFLDESTALRLNDDIERELYIFDRLLYKMNSPFRRHRHFQLAKALKKSINRCFDRDRGHVKDSSVVLRQFAISIRLDEKDELYCPSSEYFRFLLANLRLIAISLSHIAASCVDCSRRTLHMLDLGHFVEPHCLLLGVMSRFRSDCCRRLHLLKRFFIDFKTQEYLSAGLKLKCASSDFGFHQNEDPYLRIFDGLSEMEQVLDQNIRVDVDNLSAVVRKETISYFEELFNVRLVQQREKKEATKKRKRKIKRIDMKFQQALLPSSTTAEINYDLGIPIKDNKRDKSTQAAVECCIAEIERANTVELMKKFATRLEKANIGKVRVKALRFLRNEIKKIDGNPDQRNSKSLKQRLIKIQTKLKQLLR